MGEPDSVNAGITYTGNRVNICDPFSKFPARPLFSFFYFNIISDILTVNTEDSEQGFDVPELYNTEGKAERVLALQVTLNSF